MSDNFMENKYKGYISLFRSILDNWTFDDKPYSKGQAWIYLLLSANYEYKKLFFNGILFNIIPSQFITSMLKLSDKWGWSIGKVKCFLQALQNDEMITFKNENKYTTITICNYETYQNKIKQERKQNENKIETKEKQTENKMKTERKQNETDNNNNNINKENNFNNEINTPLPPEGETVDSKISNPELESEKKKEKNSAKKEKKDISETDIIYPYTTPEFMQAWNAWLKYLDAKRKTPLNMTKQAQLKKLSQYIEPAAIEMIYTSIEKGWQGIFELKNSKYFANGKTKEQYKSEFTESRKQSNQFIDDFYAGKKPVGTDEH